MADVIQIRRDTAANWTSVNPVLHQGELGLETDTKKVKIGDGSSAWNSMPHASFDLPPLSDLNRIFAINGNGIPMLPDNAAGTVCTNRSTEWFTNQCTLSMSGSVLSLTTTGGDPFISRAISMSGSANRYIRVVFDSPISDDLVIFYATSGHGHDGGYQKTIPFAVGKNVLDIDMGSLTVGGSDWVNNTITGIRLDFGGVSGVTYKVYGIYVGSGLYDTSVYGLDGQSVWTNHGVVPVNGKRGKAMLFQGAQWLESSGQNISSAEGTITFRLKRNAVGSAMERLISDYDFSSNTGISIYLTGDGFLEINYGFGISHAPLATGIRVNDTSWHTFFITYDSTRLYVYQDGELVVTITTGSLHPSTLNMYIGRASHWNGEHANVTLDDVRVYSIKKTADEAMRYHNGDDPVDCQQKSQTNAPYSLTVRDALGLIRQPGLSVYADNTAALAGGLVAGQPYRTSTGVLMIVY